MPVVTSIEVKSETSRKAKVYLDGDWWKTLDREVIESLGLYPTLVVDEAELAAFEERVDEEKAKLFVLRSISAKAQTRAELAKKLKEREVPEEVAGRVLDKVESYGFINDEEVARSLLRSLIDRGYGRRRGLTKLKEKGIDQELADALVTEMFPNDDEEQQTAAYHALKSKRISEDPKDRKRALDFLIRRGFSYGDAAVALKERLREAAEAAEEAEEAEEAAATAAELSA